MIQVSKKKKICWLCVPLMVLVILAVSIIGMRKSRSVFQEVSSPEMLYTYSEAEVYFGREDCPTCKSAVNILEPVLKEVDKKLLYFNTNTWREHELFEKVLSDFQIDEVPAIAKIKDGECIESFPLFDEMGRMDLERVKRIIFLR